MKPSLRFEIFKRDNFTCNYCGKKSPEIKLEVDHIVPVSIGGTDDIFNLTTACFECNRGKSDNFLDFIKTEKEDNEQNSDNIDLIEGYFQHKYIKLSLENCRFYYYFPKRKIKLLKKYLKILSMKEIISTIDSVFLKFEKEKLQFNWNNLINTVLQILNNLLNNKQGQNNA